MPQAKHSLQQPDDGIHVPYAWTFDNEADRLAGTVNEGTTPIVADDVGKFARQLDDDSIYMLVGVGPLAWQTVTSALVNTVELKAIKGTAGSIAKGAVVYATGWDAVNSAIEVELAQADSASTMPALGVMNSAITDSTTGNILLSGVVTGVDLTGFAVGDPLYVSDSVAGDFQNTKPQGTSLIQRIGQVLEDGASGRLVVTGAGRSNDLPNLTAGHVWLGDSNGVPAEVQILPSAFEAYDAAGGQVITGTPTWTDIAWDTVESNTGEYTFTPGSAELTYTGPAGLLIIVSTVTLEVTATNNRSQGAMRIQRDDGVSGYQTLGGSIAEVYCRQLNYGGTMVAFKIIAAATGDKFKVQVQRNVGTATIATIASGSNISIIAPRGPAGPQGIPGSGSSVTVENDTAPIAGGPHTNLNFGAGLAASDAGSGTADIDQIDRGWSFSGYSSVATTVASGAGIVVVPIDTAIQNDSTEYTWSTGNAIEVGKAGVYEIQIEMSADKTGAVSDVQGRMNILINGAALAGSSCESYHEDGFTPISNYSATVVATLSAGDDISIGAQVIAGTDGLQTIANTSRVTVTRLRSS